MEKKEVVTLFNNIKDAQVSTMGGRNLGKVFDIRFNPITGRILYLIVEPRENVKTEFKFDTNNNIRIPVSQITVGPNQIMVKEQ